MNYSDIAHKKGEEVVYWFASPGQPIKAYVDDAKFSHTSSSMDSKEMIPLRATE